MTRDTNTAADPKLIVPFMESVREVFKTMANVDVAVGRPYVKASGVAPAHGVTGIIDFQGQTSGSVVVSFSDAAAVKLVEAFVGATVAFGHPDFADAIGELANLIAGNAKGKLGTVARISTPSVVIGRDVTVAAAQAVPCLVVPCHCVHGEFTVEVCIQSARAAA